MKFSYFLVSQTHERKSPSQNTQCHESEIAEILNKNNKNSERFFFNRKKFKIFHIISWAVGMHIG